MKEFKTTYFFDEELIQNERDQYVSFRNSRRIYHELNTRNVRVTQISEYFRIDKIKNVSKNNKCRKIKLTIA